MMAGPNENVVGILRPEGNVSRERTVPKMVRSGKAQGAVGQVERAERSI